MAEFIKIVLWIFLVFAVTVPTILLVTRTNKKIAGHNPRGLQWLTYREKIRIGLMIAAGWLMFGIALVSPLYLEFPNLVGRPVVATVEGGALVYHKMGLFDPPWKWDEQEVVNVFPWDAVVRQNSFIRDAQGVGNLYWEVALGTDNIDRLYLDAKDHDPQLYRRDLKKSFMHYFVDLLPEMKDADFSLEHDKKALCAKFRERVVADYSEIKVSDCSISFNTEPPIF